MNEPVITALVGLNSLGITWLVWQQLHTKKTSTGSIILDSCALIDGRIYEILQAGLITETIIIPQFILRELQMLADGRDTHKRARARFGLEVAEKLRIQLGNKLIILNTAKNTETIDDQLIILAKNQSARLCTTDYNLNKVATIEGIKVLNVNELAQAIRTVLLPGEEQEVRLLQKGEGQGQAVGYLQDGTLVVVDGARKYIGSVQTVVIERSLQTVAGKMCFAKLKKSI